MHTPLYIVVLIVLYSTLAISGLIGNIWVLLTVSTQLFGFVNPSRTAKPALQSSAYIYLILLSVVDLVCLMPVPTIVTDIYQNFFPFGDYICRLIYICEGTNKTFSPLVLTALSIDRYIAICRPSLVWMRQTKFALAVVIICFASSLFFIVPITFMSGTNDMKDGKGRLITKCTMEPNSVPFDLVQILFCYVIPLTVIVSVYLAILSKLYRHTRYSSVGRKTSISLSRVLKCSVMVVAFYFVCWTPYWSLRVYSSLLAVFPPDANSTQETVVSVPTNATIPGEESELFNETFWMYILHAFPYTQSAFNWLFYAFLNRNLRNSTARCGNAVRSAAVTSTILENGNSASQGKSPLWKNIQHMGSQLKNVSVDTGQALLRLSPFRTRSAAQSRSTMCLDETYTDRLLSVCPANGLSASMVDLQRKCSVLVPHVESPSNKTISCAEIVPPTPPDPNDSSSQVSESSSVEWL